MTHGNSRGNSRENRQNPKRHPELKDPRVFFLKRGFNFKALVAHLDDVV
jgi:hypothetical protein